jgi:hypothetical protein
MPRVQLIVVLIVFCAVIITPVMADTNDSSNQYITNSYNYVLDGRQGTLSLALLTKLHDEYLIK